MENYQDLGPQADVPASDPQTTNAEEAAGNLQDFRSSTALERHEQVDEARASDARTSTLEWRETDKRIARRGTLILGIIVGSMMVLVIVVALGFWLIEVIRDPVSRSRTLEWLLAFLVGATLDHLYQRFRHVTSRRGEEDLK